MRLVDDSNSFLCQQAKRRLRVQQLFGIFSMGKRKRRNKNYSIDLFLKVFKHLIEVHRAREKFVLTWIWNDEKALKLFLETVIGVGNGNRDMLWNGYHLCRTEQLDAFSPTTWGKIDEIFLQKSLLSNQHGPVIILLEQFMCAFQPEVCQLLKDNEANQTSSTTHSQTWKQVAKVAPIVLEEMRGCFLGEWSVPADNIFVPDLAKMCRSFPSECVMAECNGDLTYFYERNGDDVKFIGVHLKKALKHPAMVYIKTLMEDLFPGHPKIVRHSMASLDSHVTAFGPFWQRWESDGGTKVSFYTHVLKDLPSAKDFEMLVDRYAHTHLAAIIVALFTWKLPMLMGSFFKFSKPYIDVGDYEASNLELALGGYSPFAYQLYITKDFCSEIHRDAYLSKFTIAFCSHPDFSSSTPVQFIMAEHGFRIPLENGSMFAFDSSTAHGTAYRNRTHNATYMGCVVVNSQLHALTRRRQLV